MSRRRRGRVVNGVLLLDKPGGITSNRALQRARHLLDAKKAGHTGTLDPMASGLLPLTFGEATKFSQLLLDSDKVYEAEISLGSETDSGDADGDVTSTAPVEVETAHIEPVLAGFRGDIEQVPPKFSALKRDGRPLYEYARAGIDIEVQPRPVTIHALDQLAFDGTKLSVRVHCSKGTYIRSLAVDIGRALGCGAHLSGLRRTAIGSFTADEAVTLQTLESAPEPAAWLAAVDAMASHFPLRVLDEMQSRRLLHGQPVAVEGLAEGTWRLYGPDRDFLGLGLYEEEIGCLVARRLIATGH